MFYSNFFSNFLGINKGRGFLGLGKTREQKALENEAKAAHTQIELAQGLADAAETKARALLLTAEANSTQDITNVGDTSNTSNNPESLILYGGIALAVLLIFIIVVKKKKGKKK